MTTAAAKRPRHRKPKVKATLIDAAHDPRTPTPEAPASPPVIAKSRNTSASAMTRLAVATLGEHEVCRMLPYNAVAAAAVLASVQSVGILEPLVVTSDSRVLDGRYRLAAARALGFDLVPALVFDPPAPAEFVFHVKDAREHLSDLDRAVLAVQYKKVLNGEYVAQRTRCMNDARLGIVDAENSAINEAGSPDAAIPPRVKRDSRKEACEHFRSPERKFRAVQRLATYRPDLFAKVVRGELTPQIALKQKGKNVDIARAAEASKAFVVGADGDAPNSKSGMENSIHLGDAVEVLRRVQDSIASLVMFSPAYYGVPIEYDPPLPEQTYAQYLDGLRDVLAESYRVSRAGGRLAVVLDTVHNPDAGGDADEMLPVFADVVRLARECGWWFWIDVAWKKAEVTGSKTTYGSLARCSAPGWGRDHEWVLIFFREQKKLHGDSALCDLGRDEHLAWWKTTWKLTGETRKDILTAHPAPYCEALPERLIKLLTYRRDLVIDPMNGSGTTTAVAAKLGRRYIGIDRSPRYCAFARRRVANACAVAAETPDTTEENATAVAVAATAAIPSHRRPGAAERSGERA